MLCSNFCCVDRLSLCIIFLSQLEVTNCNLTWQTVRNNLFTCIMINHFVSNTRSTASRSLIHVLDFFFFSSQLVLVEKSEINLEAIGAHCSQKTAKQAPGFSKLRRQIKNRLPKNLEEVWTNWKGGNTATLDFGPSCMARTTSFPTLTPPVPYWVSHNINYTQ